MTRQVQLSDQAYRLLKARKRPSESFSDVVIRSVAPRGDPRSLFGLGRLDPKEGYLEKMKEADRRRWQRLQRER